MFKRLEAAPTALKTAGIILLIINLVSRLTKLNMFDTTNLLKYQVWLCIVSLFIASSYETKLKKVEKGNGSIAEHFSTFCVTAFISHFYGILSLQNHNAFGIFFAKLTWDNWFDELWYALVTVFFFALFVGISLLISNILAFDFTLDFLHDFKGALKRVVKGLPSLVIEVGGLFLLNLYAKKHPETGIYNVKDIVLYIGLLVVLHIFNAFALEKILDRKDAPQGQGAFVASDTLIGLMTTLILAAITFSSYNIFGIWVSAENANLRAQIFQAVIMIAIIYFFSTTCHASFQAREDDFGEE